MAKESMKARQKKREQLVARYAKKREQLKADGNYDALQLLPRNSSPVRLRNRCSITGKPRGYIRVFGLCRNQFREMASNGKIPGVVKASW
jgi:small subunit ribosomal protein S14